MFFPELVLAAAESFSVEAILVKVLTNTGGTGVALFAIYVIYKLIMRQKDRKVETAANEPAAPVVTPARGLPVLGGGNPAGDERSGVVLVPENQPVTNQICAERQKNITTKIDAVGAQVGKLDKSLADTNRKLDKTATKLAEGVSEIKTCVAVLKDRTNRGG